MEFETPRLVLVPVSQEHTPAIYRYFTAGVVRYMVPNPAKDISETRAVVQEFIAQRESRTDYVWAITLKETREFIGLVGLHNLKEAVPELGIWTKEEAHGNHYGREAVGGVLEFAGRLGLKVLCYPVDRRNIASKKIPFFYGGRLVSPVRQVPVAGGRILEEERYEIPVKG